LSLAPQPSQSPQPSPQTTSGGTAPLKGPEIPRNWAGALRTRQGSALISPQHRSDGALCDSHRPKRLFRQTVPLASQASRIHAKGEVRPSLLATRGGRQGAAPALPGRHPAAVHVDHLAGDVAGPVRSQEQDGLGDLLRLAETLQRVHGDGLVDVLGRDSPLGLPVA
jgi:hypothetical protein